MVSTSNAAGNTGGSVTVLSGGTAAIDDYPNHQGRPSEITRNDDGTCPVCGWFNCLHVPVKLPPDPADECDPHGLTWCHTCYDPIGYVLAPVKPETVDCDAHGLTSCLDCGLNVRPELAAAWHNAPNCYGCDGEGWVWTTIAGDAGQWAPCPKCDRSGRWFSDAAIEHLRAVEDMYATGVTYSEDSRPKHQYVCNVIAGVSHSNKPMLDSPQSVANVLTPLAREKKHRCRDPRIEMRTHTPDGSQKTLLLDCGQCNGCQEWRKHKVCVRFAVGKGLNEITLLRVTNFQWDDWDAAAKWADGMGRRQPGKRWRGLRKGEDGSPEVIMAYPFLLEDHVMDLVLRDCERKSLTLAVSVGWFSGDDLYGLLDTEPTRGGEVKHFTSRFVDWPNFTDQETIYLYGEMALMEGPPSMQQSELNDFEMAVLKLAPEDAAYVCSDRWMNGLTIDPEMMHSLADAVRDDEPEGVDELVASIRGQGWRGMPGWVGPKTLLIDAARWMSDPRDETWRDAYAPVLTAAGMPYQRRREWLPVDERICTISTDPQNCTNTDGIGKSKYETRQKSEQMAGSHSRQHRDLGLTAANGTTYHQIRPGV